MREKYEAALIRDPFILDYLLLWVDELRDMAVGLSPALLTKGILNPGTVTGQSGLSEARGLSIMQKENRSILAHLHAGSPTVSKNRQVPPFMQKSPAMGHGCSCLGQAAVAVTKPQKNIRQRSKQHALKLRILEATLERGYTLSSMLLAATPFFFFPVPFSIDFRAPAFDLVKLCSSQENDIHAWGRMSDS